MFYIGAISFQKMLTLKGNEALRRHRSAPQKEKIIRLYRPYNL